MPYQNVIYLPCFTIIAMTMQGYVRILVNNFCIRFSNLKKIFCCLSHPSFWFSKANFKKLYTPRINNPTMNNPQLPFPFPMTTLQLSDNFPTKDFMTKFTFFCSKYKVFLSFLGVVISIYQLKWYLCYTKS